MYWSVKFTVCDVTVCPLLLLRITLGTNEFYDKTTEVDPANVLVELSLAFTTVYAAVTVIVAPAEAEEIVVDVMLAYV
jgi:hypothetical protein